MYTRWPQGLNYRGYVCPQIFIIIIITLKKKGVMQTNRLADV